MVAAIFGCIFGILGIFTIEAIFVPLAALCTAIAFLTGVFAGRASVLLMSIVSGCVTAVAFIVSPSAWFLLGGILVALSGGAQNGDEKTSSVASRTELAPRALTPPRPPPSTPAPQAIASSAASPSPYAAESAPTAQMALSPNREPAPGNPPERGISTTARPATAANETAIDLRCTPPPAFSGNAKNAVVASYVSVHGTYWRVRHVFASGSTVDRVTQYELHDVSAPDRIAWEGTLIHRPQLKMRGEIIQSKGTFS